MIEIFYSTEDQKLNSIDVEKFFESKEPIPPGLWFNLINPTDKEVEQVMMKTGVEENFIKAALDDEESSRIEKEDDTFFAIINTPVLSEEEGYYAYNIMPLGVIIKDDFIMTISLEDTTILSSFATGMVSSFYTFKKTRFLFQILYTVSTKFLVFLKQIDKATQRIKKELKKATKNKAVLQLLDLSNSLVYFSTALTGNDTIITKLVQSSHYLKKYEEDQDLVEDVSIENEQALTMCNIYRDILSGTLDGFASIIGNNQNLVMKRLTIITLFLEIPALIGTFFGMNTKIPWGNDKNGFLWIFLVSVLINAIVGLVMFWKNKN